MAAGRREACKRVLMRGELLAAVFLFVPPRVLPAQGADRTDSIAREYGAVLEAAKDGRRSRGSRLVALETLMRMHDPKLEAAPAWMLTAMVGDPIPVSAHGWGRSSAPPSHTTDVPQLLAELSWNERDPGIRHAAQVLRQSLELSDPGHSPLRPGAISLTVACGDRVTLESTENITLPLLVIFEGSAQADSIWLKGVVNGQPSTHRMYPPAGPIAVTYAGRQVARLTQRRSNPCPGGRRMRIL